MTEPQKVHCYVRVDRTYPFVRDALHRLLSDPDARARVIVRSVCDQHDIAGLPDLTRATLGMETEDACVPSRLASAEIYATAVSPSETQIEIEGHCSGRGDGSIDATGRAIAEAHAHTLLDTLVERIRLDSDATNIRRVLESA